MVRGRQYYDQIPDQSRFQFNQTLIFKATGKHGKRFCSAFHIHPFAKVPTTKKA